MTTYDWTKLTPFDCESICNTYSQHCHIGKHPEDYNPNWRVTPIKEIGEFLINKGYIPTNYQNFWYSPK